MSARQNGHKTQNARHKKELQLVFHALHRLLDKVHVLAPVAQRVLPARVEVYDPVHRQLARGERAVPERRESEARGILRPGASGARGSYQNSYALSSLKLVARYMGTRYFLPAVKKLR